MRSFVNWVRSLAFVVRGAHALRMGDDDGVILHYTQAIEMSPEDLDYYYARGKAHWRKKELGLAAADFTKVLELNPDDLYAHYLRGAIYRDRGYFSQAISDLNFVLDHDDPPQVHYLRAACFAEQEHYEEAMEDLEFVLEEEPRNVLALKLKADVERHLAEAA
jgi:tetratricopeptide (TPR) repeat protein